MVEMRAFEGSPNPLGFSIQGDKSNFAVYSSHASQVFLGLFAPGSIHPDKEIPLNRTGDVWHGALSGIPSGWEYSFRCEGPYDEKNGLLFNPSEWLADPYSKTLNTERKWGDRSGGPIKRHARSYIIEKKTFDWQGTRSPQIPYQDLVIYEMHARGFTQHPSSKVSHPGTFLGIIEKIPYFKKLGVNAIELMPIFEFDETNCKDVQPDTKEPLVNYWGYHTLHYFIPMRRYASGEKALSPIEEIQTLVRELHKNGIEIILDVVYNHTGEEDLKEKYYNFRGLDNPVYYQVDENGEYRNFTGCGNTINANHPAVQKLILDSLRYWVEEIKIDGFRFDLASILTRDTNGRPIDNPPLLKAIASDPAFKQVKLIAEPWDAVGLYQVGLFPKFGPWSEWNGKYRDIARRFIKGTNGKAGPFSNALCGSEWIYKSSGTPLSSINFITSHDGFTLRDLVTYQQKNNWANGEMNRDGENQNDNWNCGAEGPSQDPKIEALREQQMRNFLLALFLSQGIPMLLMGDEYGHTRQGNNNPYVQDNELNWFLWDQLAQNKKIFDYVSSLIRFRKEHPVLRQGHFLTDSDLDWHGLNPMNPDWSASSRFIAFSYKGKDPIYAAFNASFQTAQIALPQNTKWRHLILTSEDWDRHHMADPLKGPLITQLELPPYSALLAKGFDH